MKVAFAFKNELGHVKYFFFRIALWQSIGGIAHPLGLFRWKCVPLSCVEHECYSTASPVSYVNAFERYQAAVQSVGSSTVWARLRSFKADSVE